MSRRPVQKGNPKLAAKPAAQWLAATQLTATERHENEKVMLEQIAAIMKRNMAQ